MASEENEMPQSESKEQKSNQEQQKPALEEKEHPTTPQIQKIYGRSAELDLLRKALLWSDLTPSSSKPRALLWLHPDSLDLLASSLMHRDTLEKSSNLTKDEIKDLIADTLHETIKAGDFSKANPGNVLEVAVNQLLIIKGYYESVLQQARRSFVAALIAAGIGLAFFIAAVSFLLFERSASVSVVSLISGALVEVISGINFYLYSHASSQLSTFHVRLDRTQNFLLANSVCENLEGEIKQQTRAELVQIIANSRGITFNRENKSSEKGDAKY